jgi:hypothetical protein
MKKGGSALRASGVADARAAGVVGVLVLALSAAAAAAAGAGAGQQRLAVVSADANSPPMAFAMEELRRLLGQCGLKDAAKDVADWTFELAVCREMEPGSFSVGCPARADRAGAGRVFLRGQSPACVLHAVYTALERAGFCFDVTGSTPPEQLALDKLAGWNVRVRPAVATRSAFVCLNFPMDLSSWPLEEAKEYVRNLARLRLNEITFFSYDRIWFAPKSDTRSRPGGFFYGVRYDIPVDQPWAKDIRNKRVFCIPEIEAYYDDPAERGRRAIGWMRSLMAECSRVGLRVRFSSQEGLSPQAVDDLLEQYPDVGALEFITAETLERSDQDVDQAAAAEAMAAVLQRDPNSPRPRVSLPPLIGAVTGFIEAARAVGGQAAGRGRPLDLCVGIYCPAKRLHRAAVPLMRRFVPEGIGYSITPAHGAMAATRNLQAIPMTAEDWRRAVVHTWLEFDGSMYLQQNPVRGIGELLAEGRRRLGEAEPLRGVSLVHWRTAENRTAFRYAAQAMVQWPVDPNAFYAGYAASLGLGEPKAYAAAMDRLDRVDTFVRDELFNVGFCWMGTWGRRGFARFGWWKNQDLASAVGELKKVRDGLAGSLAATKRPPGRQYLEFLVNRVECSILHLRAVAEITALQPICMARPAHDPEQPASADDRKLGDPSRKPSDLTDEQRRQVRQACDRALDLMNQYTALHAKALIDRGCEGTLVSYRAIPPVVVKRIRDEYGGSGSP